MRLFGLTFALLDVAALASHASPLAGSFERITETVSDHRSDAALTELTLGRDGFLDFESSLIRDQAVRPGAFGFNENSLTFSHSPSSPFQAPSRSPGKSIVLADAPASSSSRPLSEPATNPVPKQATHIAGEVVGPPPQLDFQFLAMLRERSHSQSLLLPADIVYVRPAWLTDIYKRIIAVSVQRNRAPFAAYEVEIPAEMIEQITNHDKSLISARTDMYALRFPRAWTGPDGVPQPVEVLVRFHSLLHWTNGKLYSVLSLWSTADGGSKLALLGMCNISPKAFKRLVRVFPGIERFGVRANPTSFTRRKLAYELVPKPMED